MWWHTLGGVVGGLVGGVVLVRLLLLVVLWRLLPKKLVLGEALRLLPDLLRLLRRLAGDDQLPRGVRVRVWLLPAYLAVPIDLVPDFVPVLGYADDAIVAVVLRSVTRRAGLGRARAALARHVGRGNHPLPGRRVDTGDRYPRPQPKPALLISARGSRLPGRLSLRVRLSLLHTGGVVGVLRVLPELAHRLNRLLTSTSTHGLLGIDVAPGSSGATNGRR